VIIILGIVVGSIMLFIFKPQGMIPPLNSSCASLGLSKLSSRDMQQIENSPEYENIMILSDNDLKDVPKLSQLIQKVSNKIDYNDQSRFIVTNSEMYQYYEFLSDKFKQQHGFDTNKEKDFLILEYNERLYLLAGFGFPKAGYDTANDIELVVVKDPTIQAPKIILVDSDFGMIQNVKHAIDEIGTYQIHSYESIGMLEPEFYQYQKWFDEKYEAHYENTSRVNPYFRYGDKIYSPSFIIC